MRLHSYLLFALPSWRRWRRRRSYPVNGIPRQLLMLHILRPHNFISQSAFDLAAFYKAFGLRCYTQAQSSRIMGSDHWQHSIMELSLSSKLSPRTGRVNSSQVGAITIVINDTKNYTQRNTTNRAVEMYQTNVVSTKQCCWDAVWDSSNFQNKILQWSGGGNLLPYLVFSLVFSPAQLCSSIPKKSHRAQPAEKGCLGDTVGITSVSGTSRNYVCSFCHQIFSSPTFLPHWVYPRNFHQSFMLIAAMQWIPIIIFHNTILITMDANNDIPPPDRSSANCAANLFFMLADCWWTLFNLSQLWNTSAKLL